MEETERRNYGIDALRICSMVMVVQLHVLGRGGILNFTNMMGKGVTGRYMLAWFLETAAYCAVNCYALISGYVGLKAKYRLSNLAELWLRAVFYTVGITALFAIFQPGVVGKEQWWAAFFPVFQGQYWYLTAYVGLYLFVPFLNMAMERMEKRQFQILAIGLMVAFSLVPTLMGRDVFDLSDGYSVWWLMVLYLMGGVHREIRAFSACGYGVDACWVSSHDPAHMGRKDRRTPGASFSDRGGIAAFLHVANDTGSGCVSAAGL